MQILCFIPLMLFCLGSKDEEINELQQNMKLLMKQVELQATQIEQMQNEMEKCWGRLHREEEEVTNTASGAVKMTQCKFICICTGC